MLASLFQGTFLIILGSTLSVAFGNHSEVTYTMAELQDMYIQTGFACYAFVVLALVIFLYVVVKKLQPLKQELVDKCAEYESAIIAESRDAEAIEALDRRIAELEIKYEPYERIHPFCYCALSGCIGAQSILFGKMLAEMIGSSLRGNNQMVYPLTYVFLLCMLTCIFCQLHFLALGLKYFDALYVVPVFQVFFISCSTLGGAAYFSEFSRFTELQMIFYPVGVGSTLTGVYILSSRQMKSIRTTTTSSDGRNIQTEEEVEQPCKANSRRASQSLMSTSDVYAIKLDPHTSAMVILPPVHACERELSAGPAACAAHPIAVGDDGDVYGGVGGECAADQFFTPLHLDGIHRHTVDCQSSNITPRMEDRFFIRRPSSAGGHYGVGGEKAMSRFAQRRMTAGEGITALYEAAANGRNTAPSRATCASSSHHAGGMSRARSTGNWASEGGQFAIDRSILHAGLVVFGADAGDNTT